MLKDWLDTLPVTSHRPSDEQAKRRRERFYRDVGEYVVFTWKAQLGYFLLLGLVWLAQALWHIAEAKIAIIIVGALALTGLVAWVLFTALRPEPRRHS